MSSGSLPSGSPSPPSTGQELPVKGINASFNDLAKPKTPSQIRAESEAFNSAERLFILRVIAFGLLILLGINLAAIIVVTCFLPNDPAKIVSVDHVKDILLLFSGFIGYLVGKGNSDKKDA